MGWATTYSDDYINKVLLGNEKLQSEIERLDIALNEVNQELLDCIRENKKLKDDNERLKAKEQK